MKRNVTILFAVLLFTQPLWAHTVVATLKSETAGATALRYLFLGYQHILPGGADHVLFILSLCLLNPRLKPLLWQATAFTVAHTVTLGLSMYRVIHPDPAIVEPVIAASIMYVAIENMVARQINKTRIGIVFLFGLIHGMGFASALGELGLPAHAYLRSLLLFNLGVELGQLTIILSAWWLLLKWGRDKAYFRKMIVIPASVLIALLAGYWLTQRITATVLERQPLCSAAYADKLLQQQQSDSTVRMSEKEILFWGERLDPVHPGLTNELKYTSALLRHYQLTGNFNDVVTAQKLLERSDSAFAHKEASPLLALARLHILTHHFKEADSLFSMARMAGMRTSEIAPLSFDINFELGRVALARLALNRMAQEKDYGYYFRQARLLHYDGNIAAAITAMKKAVEKAGTNRLLQSAALSNLGDLCLHGDDPVGAFTAYRSSLELAHSDWHSMMGIGWIALVHDGDTKLASKFFSMAERQTNAPDPLLKQISLALARGDRMYAIQLASRFADTASQPAYGAMYNKYLIRLYTGFLNKPAIALPLAKEEISKRPTPQTYAWYVHTLAANGYLSEAQRVYRQQVAGKPLEALELQWMGDFLQQLKDEDNANVYFRQAAKNRYELEPGW